MTSREQQRAQVLTRLLVGELTIAETAHLLGLSERQGIYSLVADGRAEDWTTMVERNLLGVFCASQQAVRCMRASGGGTIVNISSEGGRKGIAGWSVYNARLCVSRRCRTTSA